MFMKRTILLLLTGSTILAQTPTPTPAPLPSNPYANNPEVMQRYFPHLVQSNSPGSRTTVPAGVSFDYKLERNVEPTFNMKFEGGPAEFFAQMVADIFSKANPDSPRPNILIAPELMDKPIPPFELHDVTLADLFEALNSLSGPGQGRWELTGSKQPIWVLNPPAPTGFMQPPPPTSFQSRLHSVGQRQRSAPEERQTMVFALGKYLQAYRVEDITTAIQTAWEMMPEGAMADLKFHKDTNLLIAVGPRDRLMIINEILKSLDSWWPIDPMTGEPKPAKRGEMPKTHSNAPTEGAGPARQVK